MALIRMVILIDKKDYEDLHNLMGYQIVDEDDGIILYKIFEGVVCQEWYRTVMRAGIRKLKEDFDKKKKELENNEG